jgi:hypothetical protein
VALAVLLPLGGIRNSFRLSYKRSNIYAGAWVFALVTLLILAFWLLSSP